MAFEIKVPQDYDSNIRYRADLIQKVLKDEKFGAKIRRYCQYDPIFWLDSFCWTHNPKLKAPKIPFISYPFQKEAFLDILSGIREGYDIIIDKSREMGATWLLLYAFQYFWQFYDDYNFLVSGKNETDIDKSGVMGTLFEKLRFNIRMQPKSFHSSLDVNRDMTFMRLIHKSRRSAIYGHAPGADLGRSDRVNACMLDEFASWENNKATGAWTSLADTTKCRIPISTPKGSGNKFARLIHCVDDEKIKHIRMHWTEHPLKSKNAYYLNGEDRVPVPFENAFKLYSQGVQVRSPWYDEEDERRKESDMAQEIDINYLKSGHPFFDMGALSRQRIESHTRYNLVMTQNRVYKRLEHDGIFKIFKSPNLNDQYVIGGDVSEGLVKGDESFGVVRSKLNLKVVATLNGLFKPEDFALYLYYLSLFYNEAMIACELNNHGYTTNLELERLGANMYQSYTQKGKIMKRGYLTSSKTKPIMLDRLANEINASLVSLGDEILINQCKTFVRNDGKLEADGDFLDDGVIACAIAGQVIHEYPYRNRDVVDDVLSTIDTSKSHMPLNAGFGAEL